MIDRQSSGRRWCWPALALLSLAALMAGAWWLAGLRPGSWGGARMPRIHQPPLARPAQLPPQPAALSALGASAVQGRRLPLSLQRPEGPAQAASLAPQLRHPAPAEIASEDRATHPHWTSRYWLPL